ncbi:MAG: hypothetical protein CL693_17480 [Cellvibrionaceae bacterium]|nr:hypothetical protein [Cellvibrionaceae bacterium]|tara:strand:- start:3498 stop:4241 length:744 start_codon:yes stop_codon:yes gene_type:complete
MCRSYLLWLLIGWAPVFVHAAQTLTMATSNGPPYMIQASDSGLDIDIPREALSRAGYEVDIRYMPLARAQLEVQSKRVDFMAPFFSEEVEGLYLSEPHIMYRPTAFSLASNKFELNELNDLKRFRVQTFQGAKGYFGADYVNAIALSPHYEERPDMSKLVLSLVSGRTDVVVLDYHIFSYFWNREIGDNNSHQLRAHAIFTPVPAVTAFNNPDIRDQYNAALQATIRDGTHQKLVKKHLESLPLLNE